jgi:hypothetical protein
MFEAHCYFDKDGSGTYKYRETALIPLSAKHRIQNIGEDLLFS